MGISLRPLLENNLVNEKRPFTTAKPCSGVRGRSLSNRVASVLGKVTSSPVSIATPSGVGELQAADILLRSRTSIFLSRSLPHGFPSPLGASILGTIRAPAAAPDADVTRQQTR